ncbi:MAG TPA: zf-HC2 domain-containing protein [Longimicrobiaceae bacterium]|nr:zf-HC2 domain-containing protein [Longimicrobiaceae bacterium]
MPTSLAEEHLSDGEIVRLLDGETDAGERARLEAHAAGCEACGARLRQLRRRSARLSGILLASDPEAPPAPTEVPDELTLRRMRRAGEARPVPARRPRLRVAAVVALLLAAGVVASPLRAVVAEWLRTQWERIAALAPRPAAPAAQAPASSSAEPAGSGARVQFTPQGATFRLEVAVPQAGGAVEVRRAAGASATAEQIGGGEQADLLVLPSGVRIRNAPGATADYRVTVPASVRTVRVRVGEGRETVLTADEVAEGARVGLGG